MQGKGGVGKSLLASYLAQFIRQRKGGCLAFDTDPLNATLSRTTALDANVVRILDDDHVTIMKTAFDKMIEACVETDADAVIDVGASSFIPMLEYCEANGVYDLWHEMGLGCILHTIITGKDFAHTCDQFGVVMEKTGRLPSVSSIVWLNAFAGPVENSGRGFEDTLVYQENREHIKAILAMPVFTDGMMHHDFLAMMEAGKTFDEMIADPSVHIMNRQRIKMMKERVFNTIRRAGIFE
jgi:hypothetical protein